MGHSAQSPRSPRPVERRSHRALRAGLLGTSALLVLVATACGGSDGDVDATVGEDGGGGASAAGGAGGSTAGSAAKGGAAATGGGGGAPGGAGAGVGGSAGTAGAGAAAGAAGSSAGAGGAAGASGASAGAAGASGGTAGSSGSAGAAGSSAGAAGSSAGAAGSSAGAAGVAGSGGAAGSAGGTGGSSGGAAGSGGGAAGGAGAAGQAISNIKHVVLIVQENHSFDAYFGNYCTAPPGSAPGCTAGPGCCEGAPATEPSGAKPVALDDAENGGFDPDHSAGCAVGEIDGGKMDKFVTGLSCSNAKNFAIATSQVMKTYHGYAKSYALADRYFSPYAGASAANDMYFAVAKWQFDDNAFNPDASGKGCGLPAPVVKYQGRTTIADLLIGAGHTFGVYAGGYKAMVDSLLCPAIPNDCPWNLPSPPCYYQPGDIPFQYYAQFTDDKAYIHDYDELAKNVAAGTLPTLSYVKAVQYKNEHPGYSTKISQGVGFVDETVKTILGSAYANDTLILLTWDEGGGFFDHVPPPPTSSIDGKPYGTRVGLLAIGAFARKNHVSHVVMEHSSIVKFLEYAFLGGKTGQLGARDTEVANIGSLLDPATTGIAIPED